MAHAMKVNNIVWSPSLYSIHYDRTGISHLVLWLMRLHCNTWPNTWNYTQQSYDERHFGGWTKICLKRQRIYTNGSLKKVGKQGVKNKPKKKKKLKTEMKKEKKIELILWKFLSLWDYLLSCDIFGLFPLYYRVRCYFFHVRRGGFVVYQDNNKNWTSTTRTNNKRSDFVSNKPDFVCR